MHPDADDTFDEEPVLDDRIFCVGVFLKRVVWSPSAFHEQARDLAASWERRSLIPGLASWRWLD